MDVPCVRFTFFHLFGNVAKVYMLFWTKSNELCCYELDGCTDNYLRTVYISRPLHCPVLNIAYVLANILISQVVPHSDDASSSSQQFPCSIRIDLTAASNNLLHRTFTGKFKKDDVLETLHYMLELLQHSA